MTANTPQSRKAKGREFQKAIREDIISALGIPEKDILSTPMGCPGCDIYLSTAARNKFPFGIEAKRQERLNFNKAWEQAVTNARKEGLAPLLVTKRSGRPPLVTMQWDMFLYLFEKKGVMNG